jgi:hypothetical protein
MKAQRLRKTLWLVNAALVAGVIGVAAMLVLNKPSEAKAAPDWATKALAEFNTKQPVQRLKPGVEKKDIEDVFLKPEWKDLPYFPFVGPRIPAPRPKESAVVEQVKGPTGLEAIGKVKVMMYRPPQRAGEPASASSITFEFNTGTPDKPQTGVFGPGEFVVQKGQRERFKLVDVLHPDPNVSRWKLVYDVYDDPAGKAVSRGELLVDNEPKPDGRVLRRPGDLAQAPTGTAPAPGAPGATPATPTAPLATAPGGTPGVTVVGSDAPAAAPTGSSSGADWGPEIRETGPGRRSVTITDATIERFKGQDIEKVMENIRTEEYDKDGVKGLRLTPVGDTSVADKLTLKRGDVLISIDGKPTPNRDAAIRVARGVSPEATRVSVEIDRDGQRITYDVDPRDPKTRRAAAGAANR